MNEILLVDKPAGMSSFGVVARVRRKLSEAAGTVEVRGKDGVVRRKRRKVKVGHTGTLDPFATGLLVILTGSETKRANEFLKLDKEYVAKIRLGEVSTTGDPEGEKLRLVASPASVDALRSRDRSNTAPCTTPISSKKVTAMSFSEMTTEGNLTDVRFDGKIPERVVTEKPNKRAVEKVVENLVGENWQTVPAFSAVKINGQRAYKLAREGKTVEMPRRKVQIYELEILRYEWPELEVRCKVSSGTYIRTLGEEIGKQLGMGAYLTALRRTQVGPYRIEQARTLEELGIEN